ncbi:MAG: 2-dehydropantoate 2-reductase [Acetobacteraceae bacterium]|nr:2-dehydropantoate 2-reductase [Acetobacteraceae bacterium]
MRWLVLGAGALGLIFGGRAAEAGHDVAFLCRAATAARLAAEGIRVQSPFGDIARPARVLDRATPGFDAVLLACKAYDLEGAVAAIAPAVEGGAVVVPVLNGIAHIERLWAAFGAERVLGGLARIQATRLPDGTAVQLNEWRSLVLGELAGGVSERARALAACFPAPAVLAEAVPDIRARMWQKLVHLGTVAAATLLFRATIGEIVRAGGAEVLLGLLETNAAIAAAEGFPVGEAFLAEYRAVVGDPRSAYAASMLRDAEAGLPTEAEHVIGTLARAGERAGLDVSLHRLALLHAAAHEERRRAGRLPYPRRGSSCSTSVAQ